MLITCHVSMLKRGEGGVFDVIIEFLFSELSDIFISNQNQNNVPACLYFIFFIYFTMVKRGYEEKRMSIF